MTFELPPLPYEKNALEPFISEQTMSFHYEKHHATYVKNLNELIKDTSLETESLEQIIIETEKDPSKQALFNNAAQVWNHTFFWNSLAPKNSEQAVVNDSNLCTLIKRDFGDFENLKQTLKKNAIGQFGSGWCWLVLEKDTLKVMRTSNAYNPLGSSKPLLCIDVWEHAYYLDYQNKRSDYLENIVENLLNWNFVVQNINT